MPHLQQKLKTESTSEPRQDFLKSQYPEIRKAFPFTLMFFDVFTIENNFPVTAGITFHAV
jgi:hypothetical protein